MQSNPSQVYDTMIWLRTYGTNNKFIDKNAMAYVCTTLFELDTHTQNNKCSAAISFWLRNTSEIENDKENESEIELR